MEIRLVWAQDENLAMSLNCTQPWVLLDDREELKALIQDECVVCGGRAYMHYFHGFTQPRRLIVLSTLAKHIEKPHEHMVSMQEVLENTKEESRLYILGGSKTIRSFLPIATHLHITQVYGSYLEDRDDRTATFAPKLDMKEWERVSRRGILEDARGDVYTKFVYRRVNK